MVDVAFRIKKNLNSSIEQGTAPVVANTNTLCPNLNSDLLDGNDGSFYRDASNINSGTINTDRLPQIPLSKISGGTGWRDITSDIMVKGTGSNNPTFAPFRNGLYAYQFINSILTQAWCTFHINHDYKLGSEIFLHIHWACSDTTITGNVKWGFEYSIAKGHSQEAFPASQTVTVLQTPAGQYYHMVAEISTGITSSSLEPDSLILVRIFRDGNHADDTCNTDNIFVFFADIHYQSDRYVTPNKAPNFYV